MANSVDPDQTAPLGAVWSGSALFAQAYLSENLGSLRYAWQAKVLLLIILNILPYSILLYASLYNLSESHWMLTHRHDSFFFFFSGIWKEWRSQDNEKVALLMILTKAQHNQKKAYMPS